MPNGSRLHCRLPTGLLRIEETGLEGKLGLQTIMQQVDVAENGCASKELPRCSNVGNGVSVRDDGLGGPF